MVGNSFTESAHLRQQILDRLRELSNEPMDTADLEADQLISRYLREVLGVLDLAEAFEKAKKWYS